MRLRPALCTLAFVSACAEGEPIGLPGEPLELGLSPPPVAAEVFVDVATPDGDPIVAEDVWISVAAEARAPARCMESTCDTWIADVVPEDDLTAYAQVCGFLYLEPIAMSGTTSVHVTVTADDTPCAPERRPPED
jgi:hypothetical protein